MCCIYHEYDANPDWIICEGLIIQQHLWRIRAAEDCWVMQQKCPSQLEVVTPDSFLG